MWRKWGATENVTLQLAKNVEPATAAVGLERNELNSPSGGLFVLIAMASKKLYSGTRKSGNDFKMAHFIGYRRNSCVLGCCSNSRVLI